MSEKLNAYDVQCSDGTSGRVSADSKSKAKELAEEMCQVHGGAQGEPSTRTTGEQ